MQSDKVCIKAAKIILLKPNAPTSSNMPSLLNDPSMDTLTLTHPSQKRPYGEHTSPDLNCICAS